MVKPQIRLICTDLDRTLIPNGPQPASPAAHDWFRDWVEQPEVTLVYVTGRHRELVEAAIADYGLPLPNAVITNVGATLYGIHDGTWHLHTGWRSHIAQAWQGKTADEIAPFLSDLDFLTLQEVDKQNAYKLSYYFPAQNGAEPLKQAVSQRLEKAHIAATLITSIDEENDVGLLDILPPNASKLQAIEFLIVQGNHSLNNTLFAGDSGNDLSVLASPIQAVLVANARPEVKQEALDQAAAFGHSDRLYIAQGNFLGLNGNYSAGILEGAAHYFPEVAQWLTDNL